MHDPHVPLLVGPTLRTARSRITRFRQVLCALLSGAFLLYTSGCGGSLQTNALNQATQINVTTESSTALLVVRLSNEVKPACVPTLDRVDFEVDGGPQENRVFLTVKDPPNSFVPNTYNEYLVSVKLKPGVYKVGAWGSLVYANVKEPPNGFVVKPDLGVLIKPEEVVYLGRFEIVNSMRVGNQPQNEIHLIPVPWMSATGYAEGSLKTTVVDNRVGDMGKFRAAYPVLRSVSIETRLIEPLANVARPTKRDDSSSLYQPAWEPAKVAELPTPTS